MSIRLDWDTGRFSDRVNARIDVARRAVATQLHNEMIGLAGYIVKEKLSGQVLQHRLGILAGSVRPMRTTITDTEITGGVEAGGKAAYYAIFQEYGTENEYEILPKNKKALAFMPSDGGGIVPLNQSVVNQVMRSMSRGKGSVRANAIQKFNALGGIVVKGVTHPPIKERSFMRTAYAEWEPGMKIRLRNTLIEAVRGQSPGGTSAGR